jgi:hypothetical protein
MATSKKTSTTRPRAGTSSTNRTARTTHPSPSERKPLYAVAGVGDLAIEKLREIPTQLSKLETDFGRRTSDLQGQARAFPAQAADQLKSVRNLPGVLTGKATEAYEEFAGRGEKLVRSIRRQPSTDRARSAASNAVSRARGARTATEKAAGAVAEAADDATDKLG